MSTGSRSGRGKRFRERDKAGRWNMAGARFCAECGVPRRFTREHRWLDNGTVVQRKNPDHRMVFFEGENVNGIFRGIEEIIGLPIERVIVEAKRRATFDFIDHMLPRPVKPVLRMAGVRPVVRNVSRLAAVMGYGGVKLVGLRRVHGKGDYVTIEIREPYSLALFSGDLAGTFEAVDRREAGVEYEEVSPGVYRFTAHISTHPVELQERLKPRRYSSKEGDLVLEKCPGCGGPKGLSEYRWDLERGVITDRTTGRRMVMLGPATLDAIFEELEGELGDHIPKVVVEAQRRFVKTGIMSVGEARDLEAFREKVALRGLGNLVEMQADGKGARLRIENPCLHLVLAGLSQGIYELAFGCEASMDWKLTPDGDLLVELERLT